jgi:hypothetical protein
MLHIICFTTQRRLSISPPMRAVYAANFPHSTTTPERSTSDLIHEALERLLGLTPDHSSEPPKAPELITPPTLLPHNCVQAVLARLPMDVRGGIVEGARVLNLPVSKVVTSMLVAKISPSQPAALVSSGARPQTHRSQLKARPT